MSEWQDISTAPKDRTRVLVCCAGNPRSTREAYYGVRAHKWVSESYYSQPTHWMPLPPAPTNSAEKPSPIVRDRGGSLDARAMSCGKRPEGNQSAGPGAVSDAGPGESPGAFSVSAEKPSEVRKDTLTPPTTGALSRDGAPLSEGARR